MWSVQSIFHSVSFCQSLRISDVLRWICRYSIYCSKFTNASCVCFTKLSTEPNSYNDVPSSSKKLHLSFQILAPEEMD